MIKKIAEHFFWTYHIMPFNNIFLDEDSENTDFHIEFESTENSARIMIKSCVKIIPSEMSSQPEKNCNYYTDYITH